MLGFRAGLVVIMALALGGCATRGALRIDCPNFANYIVKMPKSRLVEDIQADAGTGSPRVQALASDPRARFSLEASLAAGARSAMRPKMLLAPEAAIAN
jgi:hypothetical protein